MISTKRDIDKNKESQIVTMDILFDLSNKVASTANTESHCYDLLNESIKRQLTLASLQWAKSSTDPCIDAIDQLSFIQFSEFFFYLYNRMQSSCNVKHE